MPREHLRLGANRVEVALRCASASGRRRADPISRRDRRQRVHLLAAGARPTPARCSPASTSPTSRRASPWSSRCREQWRAVSNGRELARTERRMPRTTVSRATEPISTYLLRLCRRPVRRAARRATSELRLLVRRSRLERAREEAGRDLPPAPRGAALAASATSRSRFPSASTISCWCPSSPYGGMEHAGAIFLREDSVLFPFEPSDADRLRRAQLIFHEAAHQWFGDLVTMRWFDDLWLKEGFANLMAAKAAAALVPEYDALERVSRAQDGGLPHRRDARHHADLAGAAQPERCEIGLRQHRLQQGAGDPAPARVLPRGGRIRRRRAGVPRAARSRCGRLGRSAGGLRGRERRASAGMGARLGDGRRRAPHHARLAA